ncbi:hypothetical protein ACOACO_05425 [Nocardioides sp. CPCC 205120]|uniref:hypothetical protein n=1 Tax=Nocardioides sp. CPCC 205120 TaxID=3406462 RepID=UPI003B50E757
MSRHPTWTLELRLRPDLDPLVGTALAALADGRTLAAGELAALPPIARSLLVERVDWLRRREVDTVPCRRPDDPRAVLALDIEMHDDLEAGGGYALWWWFLWVVERPRTRGGAWCIGTHSADDLCEPEEAWFATPAGVQVGAFRPQEGRPWVTWAEVDAGWEAVGDVDLSG